MSQVRSTPSAKCTPQENSLATGGCFERKTYRVTAIGWLSLAAPPLRIYVEGSGITSIIDLCTSHEIVRSNQIAEYV